LFDDPFSHIDQDRYEAPVPAAHRVLAREAAHKSVVLLKNEGGLLPLAKSGQRIALIGPFATDTENLHGPWAAFSPQGSSVLLSDGIRDALERESDLTIVDGSGIHEASPGGIDAAVTAARAADVVVLAIGEETHMSGEAASRDSITIPAPQQALAEAVAATGTPMVIVLRNGRALALEGAVRDAQAIVVGWFLGNETGSGLADILFGDASPSGRLPVTFPLASGQQPYYYARETSGRPAPTGGMKRFTSHFIGMPDVPLYPFGHGLTYSMVEYGPTSVATTTMTQDQTLRISAEISNIGDRDVVEVVQLYIRDKVARVVQPRRRLVAFRKVALTAGTTQRIEFEITADQLSFLDQDLTPVIEPGQFTAWIAPSAADGKPAQFELV
jgi:beta-glucosidase